MLRTVVAVSAVLVLSAAFVACGNVPVNDVVSDAGPGSGGGDTEPTACKTRCDCAGAITCACFQGASCTEVCQADNCKVSCSTGSTCAVEAKNTLDYQCANDSKCTGTALDSAKVQCSNTSNCKVTVGKKANLQCSNQSTCEFTAGDQATMQCSETANCTLHCSTGAACTFQCTTTGKCTCDGAGCNLVCGTTVATTCPDGRKVCGSC